MKVNELIGDKYILFKVTSKGLTYWKPQAFGYTEQFNEAGVFTLESVNNFNLQILALCEVKAGRHLKLTHFAMTLKDAIAGTR